MYCHLPQITCSEAFLELFRAASHTISIDTVRRFDTTIAENIANRFAKNGYVYILKSTVNYRWKEHISLNADDGVADGPLSSDLKTTKPYKLNRSVKGFNYFYHAN